ncbi:MAG: hypothetical protein K5917_03715, partial [Clostridiales bacterium]|nr:hypothetical protein [Clostridiales bacterium]
MRNLTIKRTKCFAGCLSKVKIYVENPASTDMIINNTPCSILGELKNGEQKTFQIAERALKIFVITDVMFKELSNDYYQLQEGQEDVLLSGRNHFNLTNASAFLFDNNETEDVLAHRKNCAQKGLIILLSTIGLTAILASSICFYLFSDKKSKDNSITSDISTVTQSDISNTETTQVDETTTQSSTSTTEAVKEKSKEKIKEKVSTANPNVAKQNTKLIDKSEKTTSSDENTTNADTSNEKSSKRFSYNGMNITLTEDFEKISIDGFDAAFDSEDVAVLAIKDPFSSIDGFEDYTLEEYANLIIEINELNSTPRKTANGLITFYH